MITSTQPFWIGDICVSPQHNKLSRGEDSCSVPPKVMEVLIYLAQHHERVVSADELLERVWAGRIVTQSSVQKSINGLRKALHELDLKDDLVTHFAKRGYQITAPISHSAPSAATGTRLSATVLFILLALVMAFAALVFWMSIERAPKELQMKEASLSYRGREMFLHDQGLEHSVAVHQTTNRIAFVRDEQSHDATTSKLLVKRSDDSEWLLSTARGFFTDIAWSPSGRNLAVLEAHGADGPLPNRVFGQTSKFYHTFHIFTLDFKGERVIEKNVFSHWLGNVNSISWWDETELEFVASQGEADSLARYRYNIPLQNLVRVSGLPEGYQPMISKLYQGKAAVVCFVGQDQHLVFLDKNKKIIGDYLLAQEVIDLSWVPSGQDVLSGEGTLLVSAEGTLGLMTIDGQYSNVKTPLEWQGDIIQIESSSASWGALAAVELYNAALQWRKHESSTAELIWQQSNARLGAAAFNPKANSVFFATHEKLGKDTVITTFYDYNEQGATVITRLEGNAHSFVSSMANDIYYLLNNQVWQYDPVLRKHRFITNTAQNLQTLLTVNEKERYYMATVMDSGVLNVWRFDYDSIHQKQLTFGDLSSAVAAEQGIFFQYKGQQGLWFMDYQNGTVKQSNKNVPQSVKFVNSYNQGFYFVRGGPCHETELYFLNLPDNTIQLMQKRENARVNTYAVHPQHGILSGQCGLNNIDIMRMRH